MVHDNWVGVLNIWALPDAPIEQLPNIGGNYIDANGESRSVRGWVRTWSYPINPSWGPDHKIELRIDFPNTLTSSDDQRFEGYLFTQKKDAITGTTW